MMAAPLAKLACSEIGGDAVEQRPPHLRRPRATVAVAQETGVTFLGDLLGVRFARGTSSQKRNQREAMRLEKSLEILHHLVGQWLLAGIRFIQNGSSNWRTEAIHCSEQQTPGQRNRLQSRIVPRSSQAKL